uniref:MAX gene-associated protein isoform X1 n=1 Tax=Monopterus albus TaxID=43700 RepID=UPI0009B417F2|nr:MAX gene-associated protein-like isoform X1 [Monopterus albus]XP_020459362.1 MAX gene-associated protein-like isoform X1 [Monopterus albus]XP_020459363.1 MAX gene-associated protein-like isoform X1 [Monopterus albus]XP_020459365.1 MAX gene-associated protein-like isoform X1 [Monopterus albus]XP_020459366.1 MAX gene-associated protein-like isoform X1 [Monopterus albus]XP_020459367.1 MAX gene-associated protein-like isoform X1 [Monopterus albus]
MPAVDSELTSMDDHQAVEDTKESRADGSSSITLTALTSSKPPFRTTTTPNLTTETVIENKAVSMASADCSLALSSPAEASPAKPAVTSPMTFEGTAESIPATSHITSVSDSLTRTETSLVNISEPLPLLFMMPSITFGSPDLEYNFPSVLTFKGVSVTLENNSVWKQFYSCGTEMILTKPGRRMFPYCRYRLAGLDPERQYSLVLSIVPSDQYKYRWNTSKWEVTGKAEHQAQGLIRAFAHHYSPCRGSEWMSGLVSFYKLKLTNNPQDQDGHIVLHSMHRYIPRLHVIPVPDGAVPTSDQPVVMGPESITFTFPQTEFMAVTTYQNFRITQLKINHNPFAKGFRDDGHNFRLNRVASEAQPVVKTEPQPSVLNPTEQSERREGVGNLSTENPTVSASLSNVQETRLVLKPIMSTSASKDEPYVPCIRGKHALGELVLVQKRPLVEPKKENTPESQQGFSVTPEAISITPASGASTLGSSPGYRKRRKRISRRWANSRGREWKAADASPTLVRSSSLTVAMQPELDDVEGLLFVSFPSKETLEVHIRDKPASSSSSLSPVSLTTPVQLKQTVEAVPETNEEKLARLEAILLQDLRVLKHRQVIHPVLQEVGLKLSSLDHTQSVDLQYLGVHLPLPPPNRPAQDKAMDLSPGDEGLPFISRTGKTSDMTKIKGWRNKFIRSKETSPNCDGLQKNLSAFCSNMLDEYLESEAQQISERAAAFSTNPEGSVAYQLPTKSSSYVKTLDSALKHRNTASRFPAGVNRPCPLSHKPLLYSALSSLPLPVASPVLAEAQSIKQSTSSHAQAGAVLAAGENTSSVTPRFSTNLSGVSQRPTGVSHRPSGLTKFQFRLMQMEMGALNQGLSRTQLTEDRVSVALSVVLTKEMLPNQVLKVAQYPEYEATGPECGEEFCILGCVCSSLQHLSRDPLHCRRPECMFSCACFKSKITKQMSLGENEQQIPHVYSMTNMEHVVQSDPGSLVNKLWNRNIHDVDPEPIFAPKSPPQCSVPSKVLKRSSVPRPVQPIREEDKDPVYKYLESMMTCARVREFNSKLPPAVTMEPKISNISTAKPQKTTTDNLPKQYYRTVTAKKSAEKNQESAASETKVRKQVQIQSACEWGKNRKMVLETLCRRMNQNKLSQSFYVGPYHIRPVAKIFMRKPSGSMVIYRVHISKPAKLDDDEDDIDDSDEEKHNSDAEEEGVQSESVMRLGVIPFLSGVLPAGRLRARTKPLGCQAHGLIQVNGKFYNQARLLLGNMGSLHPANRLAAYVTDRLRTPGSICQKNSQKPDPTLKNNIPGPLHIKAAGTVIPPIITAHKTTDLKTTTQPPVQLSQLDSCRKGSLTFLQHPQNSIIIPVRSVDSSQGSLVNPCQNSSISSPVSLTVSPSLKTPSFLGQSGTYSFRICPPASQNTTGQTLPGVTLPGGFTIIQLPKLGGHGAAQQSEAVNTRDMAGMNKALPQKDAVLNSGHLSADSDANWAGLDMFNEVKGPSSGRSVQPGTSFELTCDEKMPSDESNEASSREVESNLDIGFEDFSSNSSDYFGEGDDDDEPLDIETVEEARQGLAIAEMKEAVIRALQESRDSSDDFDSAREPGQDQMDDEHGAMGKTRRTNHMVLERQRRSELRTLFDKLQIVLQTDPKAPRLHLLSLALKEIRNQVERSRRLEEQKKRLMQMHSVYVKQLSLLSGKSEDLIKSKLTDICERQKMREKAMKWKPFFSHLLQSRAALLQAITPESKLQTPHLSQPNINVAAFQANPHTTAAQNSSEVQQMMPMLQFHLHKALAQSSVHTPMTTPHSLPQAVSFPAQVEVTAAPSQVENQPGEPATSVQASQHESKSEDKQEAVRVPALVTMPNAQSQAHSVPVTLQITVAPDGTSPTAAKPNSQNPTAQPAHPFTLPLIRSKTGRIILPSSLKPAGQGFYTLMFMKPKGEGGKVNSSTNKQTSDVELSKNQEESFSESSQTSCSESSHILEEKKMASSNSDPKCSGPTNPLAEIASLNRSIYEALETLQTAENSQNEGTEVGLNKTQSSACLSFKSVHQIPTPVEANPDPNPPVVRRRRGRPRKHPVPILSKNTHTVVEERQSVTESETSLLAEERQSEQLPLEVTKTPAEGTTEMVSEVADNPVTVKRRRGRPPKKKPAQLCTLPLTQAGSSSSKSNDDSPLRLSGSCKSPEAKPRASPAAAAVLGDPNTLRPLTRGALGKDFPSAKKRSWIDIEKELEPDFDYE